MTKNKLKSDSPKQLSLFDILIYEKETREKECSAEPGSLNMQRAVRLAMCEAIKLCPLSRYEIAARMSVLMDIEVSHYMLDSYTSESKEGHRMPAEFLPAFCKATGNVKPLQILAEAAGLFALPGPEALRAEIQKLDEDVKRIQLEKKKRELLLKELSDKRQS